MRLLELFSGTGSVGRAFRARGWEVVSLDSDPKASPTICADILAWQPEGSFDMVWASPVCAEYSRALTRRPRDLEAGDRLVRRTLEIIAQLQPRWWAIENPQTGLLKTRPFMQHLPFCDVCYCTYGFRYRKATRIWTNLPWQPRPMCRKGSRCEAFADGRHPELAQRGSSGGRSSATHTQRQLYSMPPALCQELALVASAFSFSRAPPPSLQKLDGAPQHARQPRVVQAEELGAVLGVDAARQGLPDDAQRPDLLRH